MQNERGTARKLKRQQDARWIRIQVSIGRSYQDIADELGISRQAVQQTVKGAAHANLHLCVYMVLLDRGCWMTAAAIVDYLNEIGVNVGSSQVSSVLTNGLNGGLRPGLVVKKAVKRRLVAGGKDEYFADPNWVDDDMFGKVMVPSDILGEKPVKDSLRELMRHWMVYHNMRRAARAAGESTRADRRDDKMLRTLWEWAFECCVYCGIELEFFHVERCHAHLAHADGGANDASNIRPGCHFCNAGAERRTLEEVWALPDGYVADNGRQIVPNRRNLSAARAAEANIRRMLKS